MQNRYGSMFEAALNVAVGYVVAVTTQIFLYPILGIDLAFDRQLLVAAIFMTLGFFRSYLLRRLFVRLNWFQEK